MTPTTAPLFAHVPSYAGDPILSLMEDFQKDPNPHKVSLSIGIYFDDAGRLPVLNAVRQAETALLAQIGPRSYLPIDGLPGYRQATQHLVFGAVHEAVLGGRIATLQTLGGSGAIRIGAEFLRRYFPLSQVWVCDPTWENHRAMFEGAGCTVHTYPYYDPITGGLRFGDMLATLRTLPHQSVVLLHASCHNPTGVDLSAAQWQELIPVLREGGLIPFVDMAYQGFGDGLDADAFAPRALAAAGVQCLVANSFSKNFSLYGERVGGLSVVCDDAVTAGRVLGQLKATVRSSYSTPPTHGARIVERVLQSPELFALWEAELLEMRQRIKAMREKLHAVLSAKFQGTRNVDYFLTQRGMFSYTGLNEAQVNRLRVEYGVYLVRSGRMCMSGLSHSNVEAVATAMATVLV